MHIKNLRMHQIKKLDELQLEPGVLNTEALMLVLKKKVFPDKIQRVFKYLDAQEDPEVMAKKVYTITMLNLVKNPYIKMPELIIPDSIIYVDSKIAGFAVPLVENHKNLGTIINNSKVPLKVKLDYLYQLGNIIDKVQRVDNAKNRFQFGDLNEFNFIIDENDIVRAIDLDSAYLGIGEPLNMAYYLLKNKYILSLPDKYRTYSSSNDKKSVTDNDQNDSITSNFYGMTILNSLAKESDDITNMSPYQQYLEYLENLSNRSINDTDIVIPTDDTDLYCYNMIILNALAKENLYKQDINTYYQYLEYLKLLGLPNDLLEAFNNIYIPRSNTNPKDALEDIDPTLEEKLDFKTFRKEYMKIDD